MMNNEGSDQPRSNVRAFFLVCPRFGLRGRRREGVRASTSSSDRNAAAARR